MDNRIGEKKALVIGAGDMETPLPFLIYFFDLRTKGSTASSPPKP
jgi:hypothetical protein